MINMHILLWIQAFKQENKLEICGSSVIKQVNITVDK